MTTELLRPTNRLRRRLLRPYLFFSHHFFDPIALGAHWFNTARAVPVYFANLARYSRQNRRRPFRFSILDAWFHTYDRFAAAGSLTWHYFWQDLWAARNIHDSGVTHHVDVGSRVDGFIAHLLTFCEVTYVDIRALDLPLRNFHFRRGSILEMPYEDGTIESLSSLHVLEHIGLGRYGDAVDAEGSWKAARELVRVLAPGGRLLIGVPTGRECVCFDAHRVFAPETTVAMFAGLNLVEFSFVTDRNDLIVNASFELARASEYGCGLFQFTRRA